MQISISKYLWSLVEFYLTQNCTNICPWALNHIILATLCGLVFPGHSVRNLYKHKSFFRIKFSFFFFLSHAKCWAGWIPSWNQDCWEKYQQPRVCIWYHPNGKSEEELKRNYHLLLMKESEKAGLKFNVQKTKIMAYGPITSWQIDRKTMETVTDFIFLGSTITVDGDCSCKIIRCLILARKAMTNLHSVL